MAEVAERQGGAISMAQLLDVGLGEGAIRHRVVRGRLHRKHRGVYAVGHSRLTPRGQMWAAVLACGGPEAAALSHRSAAAVWDLLPSGAILRPPRQCAATAAGGQHHGRRHEVDFFWREQRLIVETDGAGTHLTATSFEDDRRRDAELMTLGFRVVRFTRRQVVEHPRATLATLVLLLAADG